MAIISRSRLRWFAAAVTVFTARYITPAALVDVSASAVSGAGAGSKKGDLAKSFEEAWNTVQQLPDVLKGEVIITPEGLASTATVLTAPFLRVLQIGALPARAVAAGVDAAVLFPLALRLKSTSSPASNAVTSDMVRACTALDALACPQVFVIERDDNVLQTLPLGPPPLRRFAVFISSGLVERASKQELYALFLREVFLLKNLRLHIPSFWSLLQALKSPSKHHPSRPARLKQKVDPSRKALRYLLKQAIELCRIYRGLKLISDHCNELPTDLQRGLRVLPALPDINVLTDVVDVAAVGAEYGRLAAIRSTISHAKDFEQRHQLIRLVNIAKLSSETLPAGKSIPTPREVRNNVNLVYKIGPAFSERSLQLLSNIQHPRKALQKSRRKPRRKVPLDSLLAIFAFSRRLSELEADRKAAEVIGSIEPVVGGLILLHGTETDQRRHSRRETAGMVEDAAADVKPSRRWLLWWKAATQSRFQPDLQLRIAHLAEWEKKQERQTSLESKGRISSWTQWAEMKYAEHVR